eukprot:264918-Alexandrium_andersonii.AAC.1
MYFALWRLLTPSIPTFVARFDVCEHNGAEFTSRQLWALNLRPLPGSCISSSRALDASVHAP